MKRTFTWFLLALCAALPARAGEGCGAAARAAERVAARADRDAECVTTRAPAEAARAASREAARAVVRDLERQLRAELRMRALAAEAERGGFVVTKKSVLFLDGPEVPLEWIEWADAAGARRLRHAVTTDTVVRVGPGMSLALTNLAGDITVQSWDRNEVRIHAEHDRDDRVVAELKDALLKLGVRTREASPAEVDWTLTVPAWLPVQVSGVECEIAVTGLRSAVHAQSVRGDVVVRDCQGGPLEVNTIEGEVHVADVNGNVTANSVNNVVRIVRVAGPVEAQTVNGDIQLEKIASPNVDASTVNGHVFYASPLQRHGRYAFTSHSGKVYVGVAPDQDVNVTVSSFNGQVESSLPTPLPAPRARLKGRPMRFVLGEAPAGVPTVPRTPRAPRAPGAPELELESFGGLIQLASQEEVLRAIERHHVALDSVRASVLRARRELARARRLVRDAEVPPAPAPPPPAPTPHR